MATHVARRRKVAQATAAPAPKKTKKVVAVDDAEDGYADLHVAVARPIMGPLFTTATEGLFGAFLAEIPRRRRQHYDCHCCRRFIDTFGGLVRIGEAGATKSAIWPDDVPAFFHDAVEAVRDKAERSKITGVFLSKDHVWGTPFTDPWRHLHALNPTPFRATALKNAGQAMAEKLEEYGMLCRGLAEFPEAVVEQAVRIAKSETLYRSEKVEGVATWLLELHRAIAGKTGRTREALIWRAVATAPVGFCHVRSTMIGTLLEDLASGASFEAVSRRFAEKMHPLQYQRPAAPPSAGNIARAEAVVAELASAGALRRRFARLSDVRALWTPRPPRGMPPAGGVFGHLKSTPAKPSVELPVVRMTWEKFQRTALPEAASIEFYVPSGRHGFAALVTACDPNAPPILQWDSPEERNPVSWYFYNGGSLASQWGLAALRWVPVTAICLKPSAWGSRPPTHQGEGAFFLLHGARDSQNSSLALFPETLRSEYHEIRRTIEEFSRRGRLEGAEEADACGVGFTKGEEWKNAMFRVADGNGDVAHYRLDRWD